MHRTVSITLVTLGALWAGTLVVVGALLTAGTFPTVVSLGSMTVCLGLTFISAGLFVFQVVVADRLFPHVARPLRASTEATLGVFLALGGAAIMILALQETGL